VVSIFASVRGLRASHKPRPGAPWARLEVSAATSRDWRLAGDTRIQISPSSRRSGHRPGSRIAPRRNGPAVPSVWRQGVSGGQLVVQMLGFGGGTPEPTPTGQVGALGQRP